MAAKAQVDRHVSNIERTGEVSVEQNDVLPHQFLRLIAQGGTFPLTVLVLEVEKPIETQEGAEVAVAEVEVGGEFGGVADEAAVVVEVAVVAVDIASQKIIPLLDAKGQAVRQGGVEAQSQLAVAEIRRPRGGWASDGAEGVDAEDRRGQRAKTSKPQIR